MIFIPKFSSRSWRRSATMSKYIRQVDWKNYNIILVCTDRIGECVSYSDAAGVVQLRRLLRDHGSEFPGAGADGPLYSSHHARLWSPGKDQRLPSVHAGTSGTVYRIDSARVFDLPVSLSLSLSLSGSFYLSLLFSFIHALCYVVNHRVLFHPPLKM